MTTSNPFHPPSWNYLSSKKQDVFGYVCEKITEIIGDKDFITTILRMLLGDVLISADQFNLTGPGILEKTNLTELGHQLLKFINY